MNAAPSSGEPDPQTEIITVCVPSIGRPSLVRLLRSLEEMDKPSPVRVVVADDSRDGAARRLVEASGPWRLPIDVCPVGARNISSARNACLDRAHGAFVAFVDDDEWVNGDWLVQLHQTALHYRADAVVGSINANYAPATPRWLRRTNLFRKRPGGTGTRVSIGMTGNALVRVSAIRDLHLRFDEAYGRTGGEDTDFFWRLTAAGGILIACAEAVVHEDVPAERLSVQHLRKRYTRGGYTYACVTLARKNFPARAKFYAAAVAKMAAAGVLSLAARPFRRDLSLVYATRYWGHVGKLHYAADRPSPRMY